MGENNKLKGKINKFHEMGTSPHDYKPLVSMVFTHIHNCQLCGAALNFSFILSHKDSTAEDSSKNMFIGADCVENFAEIYTPYDKENLKRKIMALIETSKQNTFLAENPTIKDVANEIKNYLSKDVFQYCRDNNMMPQYYSFMRSDFYKKVSSDLKSILRKNYLSRPKTQKIYELKKAITDGKMQKLLTHNHEMKQKKIADLVEVEKKFYDWFFNTLPVTTTQEDKQRIMERVAYDLFEQQNRLVDAKEKKVKMVLIKNVY